MKNKLTYVAIALAFIMGVCIGYTKSADAKKRCPIGTQWQCGCHIHAYTK